MSIFGKDIDALYFEYAPLADHAADCDRRGTDLWEATRFHWSSYSGDKWETAIRLTCHECGVVHFEHAGTHVELSAENTHAAEIGYGSRPEKVAGVFLWPGPRIWHGDDRGPVTYLVTATKERPRRPEDAVGKVSWSLGSRGGVRWSAGVGCADHGTVARAAEQQWPSRRAAVAWVAENCGGAL